MRFAPWGFAPWAVAGVLTFGIGCAFSGNALALEGDGLSVAPGGGPWSRWQGRVAISTSAPSWRGLANATYGGGIRLNSLSLMGDYYFGSAPATASTIASARGFRATSGLLIGARSSLSLADSAANGLSVRGNAFDRRSTPLSALPVLPGSDASGDTSAVPYLGFGYTGISAKSGWGFSADVGLMALSPGSAVKLGRVFSGTQSLDDMLRELRLSPVLQLGVSYSF